MGSKESPILLLFIILAVLLEYLRSVDKVDKSEPRLLVKVDCAVDDLGSIRSIRSERSLLLSNSSATFAERSSKVFLASRSDSLIDKNISYPQSWPG